MHLIGGVTMVNPIIRACRRARGAVLVAVLQAAVGAAVAQDGAVTVSKVTDDSVRTVYLHESKSNRE